MSDNQTPNDIQQERKKISLKDAINQKLAAKKQSTASASNLSGHVNSTKKMQSQQTKKANNQRRRTGV